MSGEYKGVGQFDTDESDLPNVVGIVSAYVSNNSLRAADLPGLIDSVHTAIRQLGDSPAPVPNMPAVPVKKSLTRDFIICLEDGKKFKSLRRHLSASFNMTPDEYRAKWNLPSDYPMVAPSYSATRSQLARDSGLGQFAAAQAKAARADAGAGQADDPPAEAMVAEPDEAQPAPKTGRGRARKVT